MEAEGCLVSPFLLLGLWDKSCQALLRRCPPIRHGCAVSVSLLSTAIVPAMERALLRLLPSAPPLSGLAPARPGYAALRSLCASWLCLRDAPPGQYG